MSFKKSVSMLFIVSQILFITGAFASDSPETTLLINTIALQGSAFSQDVLQTQVNANITKYLATAPEEGRTERLEQALVSLGVYTPEQAEVFVGDAQAAMTRAETADPTMKEQFSKALDQEMSQLVSLHPMGAQFSGCTIAGLLSAGTFITGLVLLPGQNDGSPQAQVGVTLAIIGIVGMFALVGTC